jgi:predicted O-linked N-acetylglucosamine transferase (SPINDLY family)
LLEILSRYAESGFSATPEELVQVGPYPSYSLMYHGRNDRPIREAYARLFAPCFPQPRLDYVTTGNNRIGFVVTKSHEDLFVRSMGGVLRHIDTSRFEITVICSVSREKYVRELVNCERIRVLPVPEQIAAMAETLKRARFDILYYWEIATDPLNYFLPFFRLAPVQCTSWGIQVTSGIPTVDYYLSSNLVEPEDADQNYTEKLICADTLLTYQYRSHLPKPAKEREDFGFGQNQHLYVFTQQMGKFHPDFDAVVGKILRNDPQGILVVLQGMWPYTAEQLRTRLSRTIGDVIERVTFLPRLNHADLLCLIADSEVLLDAPYYGGVNSSYDGFSVNTPILTCESPFHIGRYTAACYRKMGLDDCISPNLDAYVETAVDLGTNPQHRARLSHRISEASHRLFEDMSAVREHERIFSALLEQR